MTDRLQKLQQLHDADPTDPFVTYGIAMEYVKTGDAETAIQWLDRTLELDATYCYAYYQKGQMLIQTDRRREARQVIEQGVAKAKQSGDAKASAELQDLLGLV